MFSYSHIFLFTAFYSQLVTLQQKDLHIVKYILAFIILTFSLMEEYFNPTKVKYIWVWPEKIEQRQDV